MTGVVLDASVLIAALMADGRARWAILHTRATLYAPPLIFEELERHRRRIAARAGVSEAVLRGLLGDLRSRVAIIPPEVLEPYMEEAKALAAAADAAGDEDYVAAALALGAPVWTYDEDFRRIRRIRTVATEDLLAGFG
jgi:predicted nucleic acid-binding protein